MSLTGLPHTAARLEQKQEKKKQKRGARCASWDSIPQPLGSDPVCVATGLADGSRQNKGSVLGMLYVWVI